MNFKAHTAITRVEKEFDHELVIHAEEARRANEKLLKDLSTRNVLFAGKPLPTSLKPHFVPSRLARQWTTDIEQLFAILDRVATRFIADKGFQGRLGLPQSAGDLLAVDPGYPQYAVLARPDVLWQGERIGIVEINTDSPAMMTFADEVEELQRNLFPLSGFRGRVVTPERTRTRRLFDAILACHATRNGHNTSPTIAIVDWNTVKTLDEQKLTAKHFEAFGAQAFVCDPRELSITDGKLYAHGRSIDVVYRRVLFPEFLSKAQELAVLTRAYRDGIVTVVNPLRSYLVGTKGLLAALCSDDNVCDLTSEERAHVSKIVPETRVVNADLSARLIDDQINWALKSALGHGGENVSLGPSTDKESWRKVLASAQAEPYVAQRMLEIPEYHLPQFDGGNLATLQRYFANWNPFVYLGKSAGSITRASVSPLVSITARGALLPTVTVADE